MRRPLGPRRAPMLTERGDLERRLDVVDVRDVLGGVGDEGIEVDVLFDLPVVARHQQHLRGGSVRGVNGSARGVKGRLPRSHALSSTLQMITAMMKSSNG